MTTLCLCDLVETHADRVRLTLVAVQTAVVAASGIALHAPPAPMLPTSRVAVPHDASRFRISSPGLETAA